MSDDLLRGNSAMRLAFLLVFTSVNASFHCALAQHPAATVAAFASGPIAGLNAGATPADTYSIVVTPGQPNYLYALTEYYPSTCTEVSSGSWTVNSPPKYGSTSFGTVTGSIAGCPGVVFTFGAIYYTLGKPKEGLKADSLTATWQSPDFNIPETFNLTIPSISIVSEDITMDSIVVDPEPSGMSGQLMIVAVGSTTKPTVVNQSVAGGSQITLSYGETKTPLPPSHYSQLKAKWTVNGVGLLGKRNTNFTALGLYQNTVYNIPAESQCSGPPSPVTLWRVSGKCTSSAGLFKSDFISQTVLNGTGDPLIGGHTHQEAYCAAGGNNFRHPYSIVTACGNSNLSDTTIAVNLSTGVLQCGDDVLFVGEKPAGGAIGVTKVVTDNCPACSNTPTGGHVDNFTTSHACSGTSLPNHQAVLIGR